MLTVFKSSHIDWTSCKLRGGYRIFLRRGAPLRNDVTDRWGEQILKQNTKKKASSQREGGAHPRTLPLDPPLKLYTLKMVERNYFLTAEKRKQKKEMKNCNTNVIISLLLCSCETRFNMRLERKPLGPGLSFSCLLSSYPEIVCKKWFIKQERLDLHPCFKAFGTRGCK